jgi:dTMP kinase
VTGLFVTLEGGDAVGKTTQAGALEQWLTGLGHRVVRTREPGGTSLGTGIRELVLHRPQPITPRAEALLYAADRAEHVARVVRPALDRGVVVLTDRYIDSSVAYQGYGRGLDPETILRMSRWATSELLPDLTVLLDLPVDEGMRRARARGRASGTETDRIEAEAREFHERIRRGFLRLAAEDSPRYALVDATQDPDEVAEAVRRAVEPTLSHPPAARDQLDASASDSVSA